jgi:D-arabinose 1-dehydrogenase-like Zn-dependent alcohol dehydrogenase
LPSCSVWAGPEPFSQRYQWCCDGDACVRLAVRGKFIVVGVPQDPVQLNAFPLVFGGRSIHGSLTGTPIDSEDTLAFSVVENIPMIETFPLEKAADAYARMMEGKARFRMVLLTKGSRINDPVFQRNDD